MSLVSVPEQVSDEFAGLGSRLLFRLARNQGQEIDPLEVHRSLREHSSELPPNRTAEGLVNCLAEVGRAHGLCLRAVEWPPNRVDELAPAFSAAVTCVGTDPLRFLVMTGPRHKADWSRFQSDPRVEESIGASVAREELRRCGDSPIRWLVQDETIFDSEKGPPGGHDHEAGHAHSSPLDRLVGLLRAEWSDLWVVLVFALVVGILTLATPIAVESLVNTVAFGQFLQPIVVLSSILLVMLLFAAGLRALQAYVVEIIQRRMFVRLASVLAWRFPRIRLEACDERSLREMTNRFFEIASMQKAAATLLLDGLALVLGSLIGMSVLAFYHPWLLGFDLILLALVTFTIFVLGRGAVPTSIEESRAKYATADWLEQIADSVSSFKSSSSRDLAMTRTDRRVAEYLARRSGHFRIVLRQSVFAMFLQALGSTVLLGLGGWLVIQGQLTLGQLVAAELIVTIILGSFAKLGKHLESYYDLMASLDKLGHLVDLPVERNDGEPLPRTETGASIRVSGLRYRFGHSASDALSGVSFAVEPGRSVAVVGAAGTGKSTLIDLLYGLRAPQSGRIEIDGRPLCEVRLDSLHRQVALARNPEIFDGTILENLLVGRTHVSLDDVRSVLADVQLLDTVRALPSGHSTRLLESGAPLSRQQQLQLVLARALLGSPRLLLIDGTLDALSDPVLNAIWDQICQRAGMTIVLVTGREALIEKCDQLIELRGASPVRALLTAEV